MAKIQGGKMEKVLTIQGPKDTWGTRTVVTYGVFDKIPKTMLGKDTKVVSIEHVMVVR